MSTRTMLIWLGATALLGGCEAQKCEAQNGQSAICLKSLKRFDGTADTESAAYTAGADVNVHSRNGTLDVVRGSTDDTVTATFQPFVMRAYDTSDSVIADDLSKLETSVAADADGNVTVDVSRDNGAENTLGADLTVELPSSFAGTLGIRQDNGETNVHFVGTAVGVTVTSDNGACDVATAASDVSVHCDNGDLTASIDAVTPQTGSGFSTGNGSITLSLPSDGAFSVEAQALAGGVVNVEHLPAACAVNMASNAAKTVSCNNATDADPIYTVKADGTGLADVTLRF
jgi:hypothetical protein